MWNPFHYSATPEAASSYYLNNDSYSNTSYENSRLSSPYLDSSLYANAQFNQCYYSTEPYHQTYQSVYASNLNYSNTPASSYYPNSAEHIQSPASAASSTPSYQNYSTYSSNSSYLTPQSTPDTATAGPIAYSKCLNYESPVAPVRKTQAAPARSSPESTGNKLNKNVKIKLEDANMWEQFDSVGTEMIVTKTGRRMFPALRVSVSGLNANLKYNLIVDIVPLDDNRYKYQSGKWIVNGKAEAHFSGR